MAGVALPAGEAVFAGVVDVVVELEESPSHPGDEGDAEGEPGPEGRLCQLLQEGSAARVVLVDVLDLVALLLPDETVLEVVEGMPSRWCWARPSAVGQVFGAASRRRFSPRSLRPVTVSTRGGPALNTPRMQGNCPERSRPLHALDVVQRRAPSAVSVATVIAVAADGRARGRCGANSGEWLAGSAAKRSAVPPALAVAAHCRGPTTPTIQ